MAGNTFGQAFRITTAGESHGPGNVVIVDGCPPGIPLSVDDLAADLARRRPGQSSIVTQRQETDAPEILALRRRQAKNLLATLLLSQGVPSQPTFAWEGPRSM